VDTFRAQSALHLIVVLAIVVLTLAAIAVRRRRGGDASAVGPIERATSLGYVALWAGTFVWLNTGPKHDPLTTWPLQLCHWVALADAIVLAAPWRPLRAVAYFCGLALCTQAIFTPSLVEGPAHWPFWFFWTTHAMIVAVPAYDIAARGFRPSWADWRVACAVADRLRRADPAGRPRDRLELRLRRTFEAGRPVDRRRARAMAGAAGDHRRHRIRAMSLLMIPWAMARRFRAVRPARR
jgi:hypothetical integral membrane protein (TIGR02206 family)